MSDLALKIKMLFWFVCEAIRNWKETVWNTDLDGYYCCSGRDYEGPCGCQGVSTRDVYTDMINPNPAERKRNE